ncbi:MAG: CHAT domain-containing protein [Phycisphaerales bacterium]|nr:CHAT domain-containing protein [Phycisphaerales bacterium]
MKSSLPQFSWIALVALLASFCDAGQKVIGSDAQEDGRNAPYQCDLSEKEKKCVEALTKRIADLRKQGQYRDAIRAAEEIFVIRTKIQGKEHWKTSDARRVVETLKRIAELPIDVQLELQGADETGEDESEPNARHQIEIRSRLMGQSHIETLTWISRLAFHLRHEGRMSESELLYRRAIEGLRQTIGDDHPDTLRNLSHLAMILHEQGEFASSERLFRQVAETRQRVQGEDHSDTRGAMHNLACVLFLQGKYAESETLFRRLLRWFRDQHGEMHGLTLTTMGSLAEVLHAQKKWIEAEALLRRRLELHRQKYGKADPDIHTMHSLASLLHDKGDFAEAERFYRDTLDAHRNTKGIEDKKLVQLMNNLAELLYARGRFSEAEAVWISATDSFETVRQRISFDGFKRVRFASQVSPLPSLAACLARNGKPVQAWQRLEASLGRGVVDAIDVVADRMAETLTADERRRKTQLLAQLSKLDEQISILSTKNADEQEQRLLLNVRKERDTAEAKLVTFEKEIADRYGIVAGEIFKLSRIQRHLGPDTAILAWVDVGPHPKALDPNGDHWACVVRNEGEPRWIKLPGSGEGGTWTDKDDQQSARVASLVAKRPRERPDAHVETTSLYRQRIEPVEPCLKGVKRLIVLPAGRMGAVPIEMLTDKYAVSYAPSGTMYAWLKEKTSKSQSINESKRQDGIQSAPGNATLLALGDPRVEQGSEWGSQFDALPGSRHEVRTIAALFGDSTQTSLLLGSLASERNLERLLADGKLEQFQYIHLATHGELNDKEPWRSALILSQDRLRDTPQRVFNGGLSYDGRLTAEQVARTWKLNADLVTLSGCETALGRTEGGEGFLGFSQALFVSGARSLALSLWKVDDKATTLLMHRFYENLLGRFDRPRIVLGQSFPSGQPMPKAEALREAKQWLRRGSPQRNRTTLTNLGFDMVEERLAMARGGIRISREKPRIPYDYSDPHYWAAFVLIGNPE